MAEHKRQNVLALADTVTDTPAAAADKNALQAMEAERDKALAMIAAREDILQIVAHDLRNPLNLVKVGGSLLRKMVRSGGAPSVDAGRVGEVADSLMTAVRRMERLINDLLDLEALDKGSLRLVRGPANAWMIVTEVLDEMRPRADDKGVGIVAEMPRRAIAIECDKDRIAQILENLIANAIKFSPKGSRVTVRLKEDDGDARFEVADEGPGIADADLPRIFDPFFRAKVAQGRGLGLGLSISLALVRAHDGAIWAESAQGKGATFVFTVPSHDVRRDTVEMPAIRMPGWNPKRN